MTAEDIHLGQHGQLGYHSSLERENRAVSNLFLCLQTGSGAKSPRQWVEMINPLVVSRLKFDAYHSHFVSRFIMAAA
jgi:hypothetical protein